MVKSKESMSVKLLEITFGTTGLTYKTLVFFFHPLLKILNVMAINIWTEIHIYISIQSTILKLVQVNVWNNIVLSPIKLCTNFDTASFHSS